MATTEQQLKAYGHLQSVGLANLGDTAARESAAHVDSSVLVSRCCGTPDNYDDEIADLAEDTPGNHAILLSESLGMTTEEAYHLARCHRSLRATSGRGSWPAGCHEEISPDRHVVKYYVRYDTFPDHYKYPLKEEELNSLVINSQVWPWSLEQLKDEWLNKPMLDLAFHLLDESYRRIGVKNIRLDEERGHDILVRSRFISGGTIGIGWFPNGSCSDVTEYHIDSSWRPDLDKCSLLLNHENGHCHGFVHQFSQQSRHKSVMSYSWPNHTYGFLTGEENILPRDASWGQITEFFGGEPFPPEEEPPILPPDYNGIVILQGKPYRLRVLPADQFENINGVFTYDGKLLGFQLLENE